MSNSSAGKRERPQPRREDNDSEDVERRGDTTDKTNEASHAVDELLDEIDKALRSSLGLDENDTDEKFAERAVQAVAGYVQKGGQ
jgi:hypothetical protein